FSIAMASTKVVAPILGMEFSSLEEARRYYLDYALEQGFMIKPRSEKKGRLPLDIVTSVVFACRPWGAKQSENERCLARMKVTIDESFRKWKITSFNNVHNHDVLPLHVPGVDADLAEKIERLYPYVDPADFESSYVHEFDSDGYPYSDHEVPAFDSDFYPYSD
ncbi:hypothetical protein Dimus_005206, partial [Dionaea muscipula]